MARSARFVVVPAIPVLTLCDAVHEALAIWPGGLVRQFLFLSTETALSDLLSLCVQTPSKKRAIKAAPKSGAKDGTADVEMS